VGGQAVSNVLSRTASGVPAKLAASAPGRHCAVQDADSEWLGETELEACVTEPAVLQRKHSLLSFACTTAAGTLREAGRFSAAAAGRPGAIHDSVCWGDVVRSASLDSSAHRAHTPCCSRCTPRSWRGCGRASDPSAHPRAGSESPNRQQGRVCGHLSRRRRRDPALLHGTPGRRAGPAQATRGMRYCVCPTLHLT
jgi:hypothetical protein